MAVYTTELRKIVDWPSLNTVLSQYPIHDEDHRATLNTLFIEYYRFREIGYETAEMFVQRLYAKLLEIMPPYNQLYETAGRSYDYLVNVDLATTGQQTSEGTATGSTGATGGSTSDSTSASTSDQYDMPQTQLEQSGDYLSSRGTSQGTTHGDGTSQSTEDRSDTSTGQSDTLGTTKGLSGVSAAQLLLEYRSTILNIDQMIIQELGTLFMQVWRPVHTRDH